MLIVREGFETDLIAGEGGGGVAGCALAGQICRLTELRCARSGFLHITIESKSCFISRDRMVHPYAVFFSPVEASLYLYTSFRVGSSLAAVRQSPVKGPSIPRMA